MAAFRSAVSTAALSCVVAFSLEATANGKFPSADQLVVNPVDENQMLLRTTYGILISPNGGQDWDWICESAALYQDYEPGVALLGDGTMISGLFEGIGRSTPDGCDWSLALEGIAVDVSVDPNDPSKGIAVTTEGTTTRYWESENFGRNFQQVGPALPAGFVATTIDKAPSDSDVVYASGSVVNGMDVDGSFARSFDGGASWEVISIPNSDASSIPYIGAVHPTDPDTVYVRVDRDAPRLLVTQDAGTNWFEPGVGLELGLLRGLAVSPDGSRIAIGTEFEGIYMADTTDYAFSKVSELAVRCLTWRPDALYICVNEVLYGDGFILGKSTDEAATVEPLLTLACARGPIVCATGTTVGDQCPDQWPALQEQLKSNECGAGGSGAGASGVGGMMSGSGAGGDGNAGGTGGGGEGVQPPNDDDGCSCEAVGGHREGRHGFIFLIGLAAMSAFRYFAKPTAG